MENAFKPLPKRESLDPRARNDLSDDEIVEDLSNLQAPNGYALDFRHANASMCSYFARKTLCLKCGRQSTGRAAAGTAPAQNERAFGVRAINADLQAGGFDGRSGRICRLGYPPFNLLTLLRRASPLVLGRIVGIKLSEQLGQQLDSLLGAS